MSTYEKVKDMEVLEKYHEILSEWRRNGYWQDFISIEEMARFLNTSKYQIQKAYRNLKEKGYMKIDKAPIYWEEYDNGLYTQTIPILFTKVYVITKEGEKMLQEIVEDRNDSSTSNEN